MAIGGMRSCRAAGCGRAHRNKNGYCDQHKKLGCGWFRTSAKSRHARGYGTDWDRLRRLILQRDSYMCQPCLRAGRITKANAVDHIVSKANGGGDRESNLESICNECHAKKTVFDRNCNRSQGVCKRA